MLGRPEPPMRKAPNRLPDDIDAAVRKNGLETDGFIRVVESDMDFDGCYLTAWTALDDKGIYFILGDEKVTKKRGNKKIKSEYELREIRSYPLSDFDSLKCEQYVSTGRLIAEKDGDDIGLIKFSLNFLGGYDEFCKAFNAKTQGMEPGLPIPCVITAYADKSFTFVMKTPPATILIKKAAKIQKGSARPHTDKVGKITRAQAEEIAKAKEPDLTAADLDAAVRTIAGSARSMGITVEGL